MADVPQAAADAAYALIEQYALQIAMPEEIDHDEARTFADAILEAAAPFIATRAAAAGRERIRPLLAALHRVYQVVWNEIGTVESDVEGYNLLSYADCNAIEDACIAADRLLQDTPFADLLEDGHG